MNAFPENGFLRLTQIIGSKKKGEPPIIPVSKATWWAGVKSGRYPKPTKALGDRITAWHSADIIALIESAKNVEARK
jgi:prophage regulatory protein